jgi:hypothetical protein
MVERVIRKQRVRRQRFDIIRHALRAIAELLSDLWTVFRVT